MALIVKDRVREASTTSGTGTLTLGGAISGFQTFSVIGDGNTTYYTIVDASTGSWEVGIGTYTASGTTLSRTQVLESSNGGALVSFSATAKDVFCTYPAERSVSQADVGTDPNEIPLNQYLGSLAYQDLNSVTIEGGVATLDSATITSIQNDTAISNVEPSLMLNFAQVKKLDPRITYARASTGVYYDGVTNSKAEENLLLQSQTFDNASWAKTAVVITADTAIAPDGTTSGDTLDDGVGTSQKFILQSPIYLASTTYAASCFFKNVDRQYASIAIAGASGSAVAIEFDLVGGTVNRTASNGWVLVSSGIADIGNGWYKGFCVFTTNASISLPRFYIQPSDGTSTLNVTADFGRVSYTGTNKQFFLWGAQLEQRSAVSSYTPTTTQAITRYQPTLLTAPSGVARFDHNPISTESLGFLVEEQRTNLFTYSEDFENAAWSNKTNLTVEPNTVVAPDGTLTGDKIIPTVGSSSRLVSRTVSAPSSSAMYMYAKYAGQQFIQLHLGQLGMSIAYANFDILNGAVGTIGGSTISSSITSVGNGWYLCSFLRVTSGSASAGLYIVPTASAGFAPVVTGDGYSGIYIWGAQLEAGSFPTSYIKTVASQVTRAADSASMTGVNFSSWYSNAEGTIYTDSVTYGGNGPVAYLSDNTSSNYHQINANFGGANQFTAYVLTNGVNAVNFNSTTLTYGTNFKIGYGFETNNFAASVNGASVSTDTVGTLPLVTRLDIGRRNDGSYTTSSTIKKLSYYPARLSNEELQEMTS